MGHIVVVRPLLALALAALLSSCAMPTETTPPTIRVLVPYVGQGTGAIVAQGERAIAFDAGPDGSAALADLLRREGIVRVDVLFVSHWDLDHVGGLDTLLARGMVGSIVHGSEPAEAWMRARKDAWCRRIPGGCILARSGTSIGVPGNMRTEIVHTRPDASTDNDRGLVARLVDARNEGVLLAPGDIDTATEAALVERGAHLRSRVLLVGHHGSRGASSLAFLGRVAPESAIIQAGIANGYGHPHVEASERLRALVSRVRRLLPGETETVVFPP
jgi:competence protein ComEC